MSKRSFRQGDRPPSQPEPSYPKLEAFAPSRRQFLAGLGAAVLGAGALGALTGCGDRPLSYGPDAAPHPGYGPLPDAGLDFGSQGIPDARLQVDGEVESGVARVPDAGLDLQPDGEVLHGDPALPDAGLDLGPLPGSAPQPDAAIEDPDAGVWMGEAPLPDASGDER